MLLAIIFWLVVVSIEDPEQTKVLELPVTKMNENLFRENDKTYEVVSGNTVSITIRARQSVLRLLTTKDFEAVADFANLSFTGAVPIEITPLRYASQVSITKGGNTMMQVSIEDLASVDKMVAAKKEGEVITGKALGNITIEPNMIRIEGAKTTVDRISSVAVVLNVAGLSEEGSFVATPVLFDSAGNEIDSTDITFSEESLKVTVPLLDTKTVPVNWNINITPSDGWGIASLDYTPSEVEIAGTQEVLDSVNDINLADYSADDISANFEDQADLESVVKALGATLAHPDKDKTAKLAVKVDEYERSGAVVNFDAIELTGRSDNLKYSVVGDSSIAYTLYGIQSDLETLDKSKLKFSLDVSGLDTGTYTLQLNMTGNNKVSLASAVEVKVKIDNK